VSNQVRRFSTLRRGEPLIGKAPCSHHGGTEGTENGGTNHGGTEGTENGLTNHGDTEGTDDGSRQGAGESWRDL
jgi:hypothetical protein